jgi:hypothetical protein
VDDNVHAYQRPVDHTRVPAVALDDLDLVHHVGIPEIGNVEGRCRLALPPRAARLPGLVLAFQPRLATGDHL